MRNLQQQLFSATATTSQTSSHIDSNQLVNLSVQTIFSGVDATGTVKLQGSNDSQGTSYDNNFVPSNWSDIPNASSTVTAGVAPMIVVSNLSCQFIRVVFTRSAGTGTITVKLSAAGA